MIVTRIEQPLRKPRTTARLDMLIDGTPFLTCNSNLLFIKTGEWNGKYLRCLCPSDGSLISIQGDMNVHLVGYNPLEWWPIVEMKDEGE